MKYFAWIAIAFVAAAVIGALFVVGSPMEQRLVRFDERRVNDLQSIQWWVVEYWQAKEVLPESLQDLEDPIRNISIPTDPKTGGNYEYSVTGDLSFVLCADFALKSDDPDDPAGYLRDMSWAHESLGSWEHPEGRFCFERTIDPEIYSPRTEPATNLPAIQPERPIR